MKLKMRNISNLDTFFKVIKSSGGRKRKFKIQAQPVLLNGYRIF